MQRVRPPQPGQHTTVGVTSAGLLMRFPSRYAGRDRASEAERHGRAASAYRLAGLARGAAVPHRTFRNGRCWTSGRR